MAITHLCLLLNFLIQRRTTSLTSVAALTAASVCSALTAARCDSAVTGNVRRLAARFGDYRKDDPVSFNLQPQLEYLPQFMFNLRRSQFVQVIPVGMPSWSVPPSRLDDVVVCCTKNRKQNHSLFCPEPLSRSCIVDKVLMRQV